MNRGTKAIPSPASDLQIGEVKHVIERVGTLEWDLNSIADSLHLTPQESTELLHRRTSCVFYP